MKELEKYIGEHSEAEDPVLQELDRETHLRVPGARMISGHLQGQFLSMLSRLVQPMFILELGTFTGYSAICLAKGLREGGRLITIEKDDELESIALKYFKKAGMGNLIDRRTGEVLEILPGLNGPFDIVFMDADKREYPEYYRQVFGKVRKGGLIIADNTLWGGKIVNPPSLPDEQTKGIIDFNALIKNDGRVEKIILPLRDGLTLIRKK